MLRILQRGESEKRIDREREGKKAAVCPGRRRHWKKKKFSSTQKKKDSFLLGRSNGAKMTVKYVFARSWACFKTTNDWPLQFRNRPLF